MIEVNQNCYIDKELFLGALPSCIRCRLIDYALS